MSGQTMPAVAAPGGTNPDFDFLIRSWRVSHRQLTRRLVGETEWIAFDGTSATRKILAGFGNLEENELHRPTGSYIGVALRLYDPEKQQWAIYWMDSRHPGLENPVFGRFENGIGTFFGDDVLDGKPIRVRLTWIATNPNAPKWEQAFSPDGGATWETNWLMDFTPVA